MFLQVDVSGIEEKIETMLDSRLEYMIEEFISHKLKESIFLDDKLECEINLKIDRIKEKIIASYDKDFEDICNIKDFLAEKIESFDQELFAASLKAESIQKNVDSLNEIADSSDFVEIKKMIFDYQEKVEFQRMLIENLYKKLDIKCNLNFE